MSTATQNGAPPRKQLADQLDRLDRVLDGLSEGLMGAITDAVRDGTRLAVKDAVVEILTDPALRAKLLQAASPSPAPSPAPVEPKPGFWTRLKTSATNAWTSLTRKVADFFRPAVQAAAIVVAAASDPMRLLRWIRNLKHLLMVGAGTGLAVAAVSFLAPHIVSATLSGIAGGVAAVAVQASRWTRRAIDALA